MHTPKTGILLVNLGTPASYQRPDVYRYLLEFLLDPRVIDLPAVQRHLLVRGLIAAFRSGASAKTYRAIWTPEGSPLLVYSQRLAARLQATLGPECHVELAMRYQQPSIPRGLSRLRALQVEKIIVFPLFPQYASATTGSVHEKVMRTVQAWPVIPEMRFVNSYFDHPKMIEAFAQNGRPHRPEQFDHILFSFHGLPERQIRKADAGRHCLESADCCAQLSGANWFCYRAQCFATARTLAARLQLPEEKYTVCFQSRLGRAQWIQPYTNEVLEQLARKGVQRVLAFCPAFVADCLETIYEIGVEYEETFRALGGQKLQLVESLNAHPLWVEAVKEMVVSPCGE